MNRSDLVTKVQQESGLTKEQARLAVGLVFENIVKTLGEGEDVQIKNFGAFSAKEYEARKFHNPRTLTVEDLPARRLPKFKPYFKL